jgi:hypothetical protein
MIINVLKKREELVFRSLIIIKILKRGLLEVFIVEKQLRSSQAHAQFYVLILIRENPVGK